ncbi:MAG: ABC transporter permease [Gemmataceae bacterium]|nr:ABC transporter permease [Gemmataceae bacterium]
MADAAIPLLRYRPWTGAFRGEGAQPALLFLAGQAALFGLIVALSAAPLLRLFLCFAWLGLWALAVRSRAWPIARVALAQLFRRRLFWALYALALMLFLMTFFGQYLLSWASTQLGEADLRVGPVAKVSPQWLVKLLRDALKLNGSAETFRNFFWYEANTVMIVLALAGSVLIGNDLRHGSMAFYLSKPLSRWHYLLGKGIAVAVFLNLFTTLPAIALFVQYGLLESWDYFLDNSHLLVGILGYGLLLTATLTVILLAMAAWLQRTVPLIMAWAAVFVFAQAMSSALVDRLRLDPRLRLIDLWNCTYVLGNRMLGLSQADIRPSPQPEAFEAALVLLGVTFACSTYLVSRIRAVEIVR